MTQLDGTYPFRFLNKHNTCRCTSVPCRYQNQSHTHTHTHTLLHSAPRATTATPACHKFKSNSVRAAVDILYHTWPALATYTFTSQKHVCTVKVHVHSIVCATRIHPATPLACKPWTRTFQRAPGHTTMPRHWVVSVGEEHKCDIRQEFW